jgi:hypothetical protein
MNEAGDEILHAVRGPNLLAALPPGHDHRAPQRAEDRDVALRWHEHLEAWVANEGREPGTVERGAKPEPNP